jgi:PilZ domain
MARVDARRACRYRVNWTARLRLVDEASWQPAQVVNLSVTGVLLHVNRAHSVGERVEVEIDFLTQPGATTIITGVGHIVRQDQIVPGAAAVHFVVECGLTRRDDGDAPIGPSARDARLGTN